MNAPPSRPDPRDWLARRHLRLVTGLVLLAAAGLALHFSQFIRVPRLGDPLGPRLFPQILALSLAVLSLIILTGVVLRASPRSDADDLAAQGRAWAVFGLVAGYAVALPVLGYPFASALFAVLALRLMGFASLAVDAVAAVLVAAGFHVVFVLWLGVPMPAGLIGG